jgi:hypothetical protein
MRCWLPACSESSRLAGDRLNRSSRGWWEGSTVPLLPPRAYNVSFNINSRANPFRSGQFFLSEKRGAEFTAGKQRRRGRNSRSARAGIGTRQHGCACVQQVAHQSAGTSSLAAGSRASSLARRSRGLAHLASIVHETSTFEPAFHTVPEGIGGSTLLPASPSFA